MAHLRIGSRGSQLALWQANHVAALLKERGHSIAIEVIKTTGDKITEVSLAQVGTKGMFTKEIEEALAEGRVDLAVHSLKDLPTDLPPGFELAAIMKREDARDAFISKKYKSLTDLPQRSHIGTSSLRREAQLRALRPDLRVSPLRGNVDTRLRKLEAGEYDAIILAAAGVKRLGREDAIREILQPEIMCPAAGQGALGIEIRNGDRAVARHLEFLDDPAARATTECERALLQKLGGGCQVPIGAHATCSGRELHLVARVARQDGSLVISEEGRGKNPLQLGAAVGEKLLQRGAEEILREIYGTGTTVPEQP
ncbi:MAG TPA: hydroxymethylbilane synthase [Terriglobales bacterium]|jgi:hydroxymethylbilane synthase|nr:hydroxymethylbilane synthase [Terriglobales bacterium]